MKIYPKLLFFVVAVFVAGCAQNMRTGIDPSAGLPVIQGEGLKDSQPYGETGRWWLLFNDEELNSLVDEALGNNLSLSQAYERLVQAGALARETGASRYPSLMVGTSAQRSGAENQAGDEVIIETYNVSATARYEIDLWGKLSSRTRAAVLDARASREQMKALYMSVSAEIAEQYYTAIEQKAQLHLSELTVESFRDNLKLVELRYAKGVVSTLDVYQARQNLANASVQIPTFETSLASSLAEINLLLGRDPRLPFEVESSSLPIAPEFPDSIPSDLLEQRPDVQEALLRVKAQDERVAASIADRFPSFNLVGTYGGTSDTLSEVLRSQNMVWNILLDIALPVFEAGKRKAVVERSKAAFMESLSAYHETVLTALKEVHVALIRNQLTEERIGLLEEVVASGRNTLRVAQQQYLQGISNYLNVLNAQQALYTAESSLLSSRRQLISDRIQLARALGGAWMDEELEGFEKNKTETDTEQHGN